MRREYQLSFRDWRRLSRRAREAQKRGLYEVGGLLAADDLRRLQLFFVRNASLRRGEFEFGSEEFLLARMLIRAAGLWYVGSFHSHPISEAIPGSGDVRGHSVRAMLLIYDVCGVNARLWRIVRRKRRKQAVELRLVIARGPRSKH